MLRMVARLKRRAKTIPRRSPRRSMSLAGVSESALRLLFDWPISGFLHARTAPARGARLKRRQRQLRVYSFDGGIWAVSSPLRGVMKIRGYIGVVLASVLSALPAFAGVCDLRCASVGPMSSARSDAAAPNSVGEKITGASAECPLHNASRSGSGPVAPSSGPCHGHRAGNARAVLSASSSALTSSGPLRLPPFEVVSVAGRIDERSHFSRPRGLAFGRTRPSSLFRSILRV